MKHFIAIAVGTACLALLAGCKTTEANYRAAYEKAKQQGQSTAVEQEVYDNIAREQGPATSTVDGVQLPLFSTPLQPVELADIKPGTLDKFNIVTARFRQTFNAKSMARRLHQAGFTNAFVAKDRDDGYFVVACTAATARQAAEELNKLKATHTGAVAPFPYVVMK